MNRLFSFEHGIDGPNYCVVARADDAHIIFLRSGNPQRTDGKTKIIRFTIENKSTHFLTTFWGPYGTLSRVS